MSTFGHTLIPLEEWTFDPGKMCGRSDRNTGPCREPALCVGISWYYYPRSKKRAGQRKRTEARRAIALCYVHAKRYAEAHGLLLPLGEKLCRVCGMPWQTPIHPSRIGRIGKL